MAEQAPQYKSGHTDVDPFDENTADHHVARYRLRKSGRTDYPDDSVPLFLSDYDGEPDPREYMPALVAFWTDSTCLVSARERGASE